MPTYNPVVWFRRKVRYGRHTPPLDNAGRAAYLRTTLEYELHWLLRAAQEWQVQATLNLQIPGYQVQVYSMDSAFLRARGLLEFLTQRTTTNHYGCDAFGLRPLRSKLYNNSWKSVLHAFAMHTQDRTRPKRLKTSKSGVTQDLNQMPVEFASEVVRLWRAFASSLSGQTETAYRALGNDATKILAEAAAAAGEVATNEVVAKHKLSPIAW